MSASKHSPGPWQMATSCSFRRIIDATGREIIGGTVQRSDGHPDMHFANGGYEGPDARLILAAPELLEALEGLLFADESEIPPTGTSIAAWGDRLSGARKKARAAIRKAKGEA